jgi:hypothetical protein
MKIRILGTSVTKDIWLINHFKLPRTEGSQGQRTFMIKFGKSQAKLNETLAYLSGPLSRAVLELTRQTGHREGVLRRPALGCTQSLEPIQFPDLSQIQRKSLWMDQITLRTLEKVHCL